MLRKQGSFPYQGFLRKFSAFPATGKESENIQDGKALLGHPAHPHLPTEPRPSVPRLHGSGTPPPPPLPGQLCQSITSLSENNASQHPTGTSPARFEEHEDAKDLRMEMRENASWQVWLLGMAVPCRSPCRQYCPRWDNKPQESRGCSGGHFPL